MIISKKSKSEITTDQHRRIIITMAVYAAHLTRTLQGTPSIFQIAAQEALGATVKPALKRLAEVISIIKINRQSNNCTHIV